MIKFKILLLKITCYKEKEIKTMKWEYTTLDENGIEDDETYGEAWNRLGFEGWEMFQVLKYEDGNLYHFKRRLE